MCREPRQVCRGRAALRALVPDWAAANAAWLERRCSPNITPTGVVPTRSVGAPGRDGPPPLTPPMAGRSHSARRLGQAHRRPAMDATTPRAAACTSDSDRQGVWDRASTRRTRRLLSSECAVLRRARLAAALAEAGGYRPSNKPRWAGGAAGAPSVGTRDCARGWHR